MHNKFKNNSINRIFQKQFDKSYELEMRAYKMGILKREPKKVDATKI